MTVVHLTWFNEINTSLTCLTTINLELVKFTHLINEIEPYVWCRSPQQNIKLIVVGDFSVV